MSETLNIHFDNLAGFTQATLLWRNPQAAGDQTQTISTYQNDDYGIVFSVPITADVPIQFKFYDAADDQYEDDRLWRSINAAHLPNLADIWCRSWNNFVYTARPQTIAAQSASEFIEQYPMADRIYISNTGGQSALGATVLADGGVLFGLFHPHAARVYMVGDFNDWQHPAADTPQPERFLEMRLYQGYFDVPNIWLLKVDAAQVGQEYKFVVYYQSLAGDQQLETRIMVDPYARFLGADYEANNSQIIDPSGYSWGDADYQTTAIHDLIIYELHVHGFTHDNAEIDADKRGKYTGLIQRIESGYFDQLGITCLYLMPISEVPTPQGEDALGYNTSLFMCIERDFGTPQELQQLVDVAHQHGLSVIVDQVFNHAANSWNPLWQFILDHPEDALQGSEGGLYFSGESPWGNRIATERTETQNMLIDACKLMIHDYHIDGFRFDATHTHYMSHDFLHRLADELQAFKPDVILIAENLPNQGDLNRDGYNGFGQWCDYFHDGIKAFLNEFGFEGTKNEPALLGDMFYFSKNKYAAHTNNVINYCESHDEQSVAHEVSFFQNLNTPAAKERKARLGLFATLTALGQPMIYMGQEFGVERERNKVYFDFPAERDNHGFFQWASRLMRLRRRYAALKLHGFDPIADGQFDWVIGSWLAERQGAGKRVIGWRATPSENSHDTLVILLNFENHAVELDVPFGQAGSWVRLASIDVVNDIAPDGDNHAEAESSLHLDDGMAYHFVLPDSSAFIYKWQS